MPSNTVVFFFDVDNTLLDNDQVIRDLRRHLEREVGQEHSEHYWEIFEQLRTEIGYADYLGALQRYRIEHPSDPKLLTVSSFLVNYPFANRMYPNSLDVIEHCRQWGQVVILSDGDAVFQPRKVERSGIFEAVEGNVLIYIHKELELEDVVRRYPAEHYVMVDDKLRILADIKKSLGGRVTTVFPRQGHYALDPDILAKYPPADISIERIGDLIEYDLPSLLHARRQSAKPAVGFLSNGSYTVMVTKSGGGYLTRNGMAVTRWREDGVRDSWGSFCYLRDVRSGAVWSAGLQPTLRAARDYEVSFAEERIEIRRFDEGIRTRTEIIVSTEDAAELRRTTLTNESSRPREIEITSYSEIVLGSAASDAAHPAFSNLSIETEFILEANALLARRRPRSNREPEVWGLHMMDVEGEIIGATQYETDRARFVGRGRSTRDAVSVVEDRPLSNTVGAVLDPIWSLRTRIRVETGATARVTFTTAVADSREAALALADKYHAAFVFERAVSQAWTRAQVELRHLQADVEDAKLYQRLAGLLIYTDPVLRPRPHVLQLNEKTQSALWAYGISGDLPILVVRIGDARDLPLVRQALRAHEYLRAKRLAFDLVILNDHPVSCAQSLQEALLDLLRTSDYLPYLDKSGGVFLRRSDLMPDADRILLHTVARAVFVTERGTLKEQLERSVVEPELPPAFVARWPSRRYAEPTPTLLDLEQFNGLGGFTPDGREYVITLGKGQWTPAPWLNIVANEKEFGFQISESGAGFTWSVNSRENRLTPWTNDAVSDAPGEVIYLRDEDTGSLWTPTPLPVREDTPYTIRHGRGYTAFEHTSHGIVQELIVFVPVDAPVKICRLRLQNLTERARRLSVTSYHELVLGVARETSAPFVITEVDSVTGAIFARNPYNNEFAGRIAFAAVRGATVGDQTATCDRREFLGRNGALARPDALIRERLSGRAGAGLDPCAGIRCGIELAPGESRDLFVLLGEAGTREAAQRIVTRFDDAGAVDEALLRVAAYWDKLLGAVKVKTPDAAMNRMMNGWLLYQTLVSRFWSRSAFYQSGGAFGFRDQLQDVMAIICSKIRMGLVCRNGNTFHKHQIQKKY